MDTRYRFFIDLREKWHFFGVAQLLNDGICRGRPPCLPTPLPPQFPPKPPRAGAGGAGGKLTSVGFSSEKTLNSRRGEKLNDSLLWVAGAVTRSGFHKKTYPCQRGARGGWGFKLLGQPRGDCPDCSSLICATPLFSHLFSAKK